MKINSIVNMIESKRNIEIKTSKFSLSMSNVNMILYATFIIDEAEFFSTYNFNNGLYELQEFCNDFNYCVNK